MIMRQVLRGTNDSIEELRLGEASSQLRSGGHHVRSARRSARYLEALGKLDTGTNEHAQVARVIDAVQAEFGADAAIPLGLLAKCYLGSPYEVHVLDLAGAIVEHYKLHEPLPSPFEGARRLALHSSYVAIEVYPDRIVCLRADGSAAEVGS
jgi:hypothetical protein